MKNWLFLYNGEFKHIHYHFETSVSVYLHAPSEIKAIYADKVFA